MEYKEFWIAQGSLADIVCYNEKQAIDLQWTKNPIHVIEYAAFEKLKKQNEIMREALSFYASGDNWGHKHKDSCDYVVILEDQGDGEFQFNSITDDEWVGGKRARQAIKDVEGVG